MHDDVEDPEALRPQVQALPYQFLTAPLILYYVKIVLRRSLKSDRSTIRTIALSLDGTYLASGFDSGLIEIRTTTGSMDAVRLFSTGAQVNSIIWHPLVRNCFLAGSTNGNIHMVTLAKNTRSDAQKVFKVNHYIVTMALNHDASLLAVAFGRKVALLSNWLSDSGQAAKMSYLSTKDLAPQSSLDLAQNLYFVGEYTLLVFFFHRVISFSTVHPFAAGWALEAVGQTWFGRTALSPMKDQFIATNLINGFDFYSIPSKQWLRTHEFTDLPQSRVYTVAYLDARTVISGHTKSFIVVVRDTQRVGHARFQQIYLPLNTDIDRGTHAVVTGHINGNSVIVAVNGEGHHSVIYILDVLFFHSPVKNPLSKRDVSLLASMIPIIIGILVLGIYFQVRDASRACREALDLLQCS